MFADEPHGLARCGLAIAVTSDDCLVTTLSGGIDRNISVTLAALHHLVEQARGFVADAKRVGDDAGKWRIRQQADEFFVVDADDRHFLGDRHPSTPARVEHLDAANVVAGHDPQRLGQLLDPVGDTLDLVFPRGLLVAPGHAADGQTFVNLVAGGQDMIRERLLTAHRPFKNGKAEVGEMSETAVDQVFGGEPGDGRVIAVDLR